MSSKQKIIFVTGKGGVGKSVVALAYAQKQAITDRVLLVELGIHSFYADFLNIEVKYQPQNYQKNLDIALWSGTECLKEYALHLLKVESLYKLFFENKISRSLIEIAPALAELAILGKITSGIRKVGPPLEYDTIIVDGFATGHMMALLKAPRGLGEAIRFGPMSEQTTTMLNTIRDSNHCEYVVVTLPEELPAIEADELYRAILAEVGIAPKIYCNKLWPIDKVRSFRRENSKTITSEESRFIADLEDLCVRQESWLNYLKHRHPNTESLPMVFDSEPKIIIDAITRNLR